MGEAFETLRGAGEQLRDSGAVPVGVGDPGVAEVGCESQDFAIYISTFLVPAQQPAYDEGVSQVVNARLARAPLPGPVETPLDPAERRLHGGASEPGRMLGAEEVLGPRCSKTRGAAIGVAAQCLGRSRMERDESGFAELGLADGQDAVDEVGVVGRETAGFGEPQAGRGQQGEVRDIGGGSQPVSGQQAACLLQERGHLCRAVDVGH